MVTGRPIAMISCAARMPYPAPSKMIATRVRPGCAGTGRDSGIGTTAGACDSSGFWAGSAGRCAGGGAAGATARGAVGAGWRGAAGPHDARSPLQSWAMSTPTARPAPRIRPSTNPVTRCDGCCFRAARRRPTVRLLSDPGSVTPRSGRGRLRRCEVALDSLEDPLREGLLERRVAEHLLLSGVADERRLHQDRGDLVRVHNDFEFRIT